MYYHLYDYTAVSNFNEIIIILQLTTEVIQNSWGCHRKGQGSLGNPHTSGDPGSLVCLGHLDLFLGIPQAAPRDLSGSQDFGPKPRLPWLLGYPGPPEVIEAN